MVTGCKRPGVIQLPESELVYGRRGSPSLERGGAGWQGTCFGSRTKEVRFLSSRLRLLGLASRVHAGGPCSTMEPVVKAGNPGNPFYQVVAQFGLEHSARTREIAGSNPAYLTNELWPSG
jgi:hypothetical protein